MVIKTANLQKGDRVTLKVSRTQGGADLINLVVTSQRAWNNNQLRATDIGKLILDTPFFHTINSLKLYQSIVTEIVKNYPVEITLIEIERHKKKWYTTTVLNLLTSSLRKLKFGNDRLKN